MVSGWLEHKSNRVLIFVNYSMDFNTEIPKWSKPQLRHIWDIQYYMTQTG